ncbi:MAG TPA: LysR family transcriptional regulator [Terriglobales bacterium]|jgi:LysR family hydrogen peroxide-inducible transcriptional activator|nr:LysR family transcriptional regulator [Terriglobales bacterium]
MEIHQLRYFCAVVRTGGFTRAARQEHLAQPSLSQQIRKLEDELGTRLFDRLGKSVRLTSFGEAFLPRAQAILHQVADAKQEIEEMAGVERGKLIVGSIPTVAPYFLPECLATFGRKFPQIRVSVVEELTSELLDHVHDGTIDLALLVLPIPGSQFICQELLREKLYLVVPRNHRMASHATVKLKQIEGDPFLLLKDGHCFRENTLSACGRARLEPNVVFESGQFATILAMVAAGAGVSVVPEMAAQPRKGCRFIPIDDEDAFRRVGIVQLKQHFRSRAHAAFVKHSLEHSAAQRGNPQLHLRNAG